MAYPGSSPPHPGGSTGRLRGPALCLVLVLVATACGTRVDPDDYQAALQAEADRAVGAGAVNPDQSAASGPATGPAQGTPGTAAPGPGMDGTAGGPTAAGGRAGPVPGTGESLADVASEPATTTPDGTLPPRVAALSDTVVGDTIVIGMHVPITGGAPMPTDWTKYLDVVLTHMNEQLRPHGRTAQILVEDDGYDPSQAMAACRRLADAQPLVVIGHTMPAAQDTCASLFDARDIPYLMRGTTPSVLKGRPLAFFGTAPDDVQGRLLADYVVARLDGATRPVGVLYQNDQVDAKDEFVARVTARGGQVVAVEEGVPRQNDYAATIQKLRSAGAELVFISAPPVDAIKLSVQSSSQGYHPTWLGGGTYWNYNMVLESAGMAMDGAVTFSPWPTIDSAAADEFRRVYAQHRPADVAEDIGLVIWGWFMLLHQVLLDAGPDLSPRSFTEAVLRLEMTRPDWNPISYPQLGPVGSSAVAVFRADGQAKRWRQVAGFSTGF